MSGVICMAVFRPNEALLERQISSIRAQTLADWTCIVGIDGADPAAAELLGSLIGDDHRFGIIEYQANVGFYRNFERVLREVPGPTTWVALADQDDEWLPEKLERLEVLLEDASLAFCQAIVIDLAGGRPPVVTQRIVPGLVGEFIDNQVTGSACLFRTELLSLALPFPEPTRYAYHDHWLGVCAAASAGVASLDEPLQHYVQHSGNVIGEERRSVRARFTRLSTKAGGNWLARWDYLRDQRWGWRVNMAKALQGREPPLQEGDARFVEKVACGRLLPSVVWRFVVAVLRREAPLLRTLALLVGAARGRPLTAETPTAS